MAERVTYDVTQTYAIQKIRKVLGINPLPIIRAIAQGPRLDKTGDSWYEDTILGLYTNVTGPGDPILSTATTLDVTTAAIFAQGDVCEWESERVKVTSVDTTNNKITVVRGFQGTTAANHDANKKIEVVSTVAPEVTLLDGTRVSTPVKYENVTQVFEDLLEISDSLDAVSPDWANSERERMIRQKLFRLDTLKAKSIWYGIKYDSSSDKERTLGGIDYYVGNKVDAGGAALTTPNMLIEQILAAEEAGVFDMGLEYEIWMNTGYQKTVNTWYDQKLVINREDKKYGMVITFLVTNQGTFRLRFDRQIKEGDIFFIDPKEVEKRPLIPERRVPLAKDKRTKKYLLDEEFTIKVHFPSAWRKLENVATP